MSLLTDFDQLIKATLVPQGTEIDCANGFTRDADRAAATIRAQQMLIDPEGYPDESRAAPEAGRSLHVGDGGVKA